MSLTDDARCNPQISLCWKNLRYVIDEWCLVNGWKPQRQRKIILNRLNGSIRMNSLNALLGPSGAGKTSLINCLTCNVPAKNLSSDTEIYINKEILTNSSKSLVSFVPQFVHEIILGQFTVLETLYYAFCFKNVASKHDQAYQHIQSTIEELMLNPKVLNTRFENCSGGEQRRVAIAQELMSIESKPPFLFVDEPTTGLDSESALVVMKCLRRLSMQNSNTVMVSIHAPSSDILNLFDQLYIIAKGGVCIYSDPPHLLRPHLNQITGITLKEDDSPIQEYLRIASNGTSDKQVRKLTQASVERDHQRMTYLIDEKYPFKSIPKGIPHHLRKFCFCDLWTQIKRLFYFTFIADVRNLYAVIIVSIIACLLQISITNMDAMIPSGCRPINIEHFNQTCSDKLKEDRLIGTFVILMLLYVFLMLSLGIGMNTVMKINFMKVLRNEYRNGWYSYASLIHSSYINELLTSLIVMVICVFIFYMICGFVYIDNYHLNWYRFVNASLFCFLTLSYGQSFGYLLLSICIDNFEILLLLCQVTIVSLSISNSFMIAIDVMNKPVYLTMSNIISSRYLLEGLFYSYYEIDRCDSQTEYSQIAKQLFIDSDNIYSNIKYSILVMIVIRIISFIVMRWTFTNVNIGTVSSEKKEVIMTRILATPIEIIFPQKSMNVSMIDYNNNVKSELNEFQQFCKGRYIIGWRQLTLFSTETIYEVRPTPESLEKFQDTLILRNLSGQFQFGTLNAIMGSSGSGKTSLLKVFNGKMKTKLTGSTEFYLSRFTPIRTCYIRQEVSNHLIPGLTSRQSLIYASKLKNCHEKQSINHDQIATNLLDELDIANTANTMVQNCSGGERKRLALALELTSVRMPNLICIDEPVSGLDSNSAHLVLLCLQRYIARHPDVTMVVSIHQPSTEQLGMFDLCYVLAFDGLGIYSGPPARIKSFLNEASSIDDDKRYPIETLIRYSCTGHSNPIVQQLAEETDHEVAKITQLLLQDTVHIKNGLPFPRMRFSIRFVAVLLQRFIHSSIRYQWPLYFGHTIMCIFSGAALRSFFDEKIAQIDGCLSMEEDFLSICSNITDQKWIEDVRLANNVNYIFFSCFACIFMMNAQVINTFSSNFKFFTAQQQNGWHTCGAYYLAKLIFDVMTILPMAVIFVYVTDIYSSVSPNNYFVWQVFNLFIASLSFLALNNLSVMFLHKSIIALFIIIGLMLCIGILLSNIYNVIEEMNFIVRFISNISIFRYQFPATLWLIYGGERCRPYEIQSLLYMLNVPTNVENFYECIFKLIALAIFYHTIAVLVFIIKFNPLIDRYKRAECIEKYRNERLLKSNKPFMNKSFD